MSSPLASRVKRRPAITPRHVLPQTPRHLPRASWPRQRLGRSALAQPRCGKFGDGEVRQCMGDRAPPQLNDPTLYDPLPLPNPALVAACRAVLTHSGPIEVAEEYGYASLPLYVIDSVFSIGVRYESVRNVIERYCKRFGVPKQALSRSEPPPRGQQESITAFLVRVVPMHADQLATEVFGNRQRTSARNGILKADAVVQFAGALARHRIEHLQEVAEAVDLSAVEGEVRRIPGQSSGLSWRYFLMLAGRENLVKPDRMIFRFLERAVGRPVGPDEAQAMHTAAARELDREVPGIKPRTLDNEIWRQERAR